MISVEIFKGKSIEEHRVEVVERKGLGHPDYICDSVMEAVSVALSKLYIERAGAVLHHNIDKGLLAAGKAEKVFGGGRIIEPMELIIGDRATFSVGGKELKVEETALKAAKGWIAKNLRFVDPDAHVRYRSVLSKGSEELTDIFRRKGRVRGANDTSCAVGYYPLSKTEEAVLKLERYLNSKPFKGLYPETGEDVKIMGLRCGRDLDITAAMPFVSRHIRTEEEYFWRKEAVLNDMNEFLKRWSEDFGNLNLRLNTLDERGRGLGGVYLSVLGTSAEDADSGQVGRGNRVNGLISIMRPMGTEAAAGKNPASHPGKIYNVLSHKTAERIHKEIEGVKEVYVVLLSRIGAPINAPWMASAQVLLQKGEGLGNVSKRIEGIIEEELSGIPRLCDGLAAGKYGVC